MRAVSQAQARDLEKRDIPGNRRLQGARRPQPQWPRRARDLKGKGDGRGEEIQGKRMDWSSPQGVRFCVPNDWWRESSR